MTKISIAIPTYEMGGIGHEVIQYAFESLKEQTFKSFEVIVSDQSSDDKIKEVCKKWSQKLNLKYFKFNQKLGYYTANTNNAVSNCSGEIIKYLDSDDYLYDKDSLKEIYYSFDSDTNWLASAYTHTYDRISYINNHLPHWTDPIFLFNTIGSPTGVAIRKESLILMDEYFRWMGDADLYQMLFNKFGKPKILNKITAVHLLWKGQTSNTLNHLQQEEIEYALKKYKSE